MLKVAIIGCGKIADQHAAQIEHIPNCRIVAVCDREELMAEQLRERYGIAAAFTDVRALLDEAKPDVVHITTPPHSHHPLGKLCIEAGCHVYIEKPFTVTFTEARDLIDLANSKNTMLTVGHNAQFSHASEEMRDLVAAGYLGGPPLHMEGYYCYDLSDASYAKALLGDPYHWVRSLPGGLLQNTISHGISKIGEFLTTDAPEVIVHGFTSPLLRSIGENNIVDELRVLIHEGPTTAYFTFSSQMRPSLFALRLYGRRNGLMMDEHQQTVIKMSGGSYKSYLQQFIPPWNYGRLYINNSLRNIQKFLKADFHMDHGMRTLIAKFYSAIIKGDTLPIPYSEILRTSRIMDDIFSQLPGPPLRQPLQSKVQERLQLQD